MTSQGPNDEQQPATEATEDSSALPESSSVDYKAPTEAPTIEQDLKQQLGTKKQKVKPARTRNAWVFRLQVAYFMLAVLAVAAGGAWFYLQGPSFLPITIIVVGLTLLLATLALRLRSWKIGLGMATVAAAVVGGSYLYYEEGIFASETKLTVRVSDASGAPIPRTNVLVLYGGETPIRQITDVNGIVTFVADSTYREARLVAETSNYQVHDEIISLADSRDVSVTLRSLSEDVRSVIVRVVNRINLQPVNSAKILLIASGDTFSDFTDSNGIAKFNIDFASNVLDADLTVEAAGTDINNQSISLRPDQLQEVRLDGSTQTVNVAPVTAITGSNLRESGGAGFNSLVSIANIDFFDSPSSIGEREPNDEVTSAQALDSIGADRPVVAKIDQNGDRDNYSFDAVVGRTYVVELYNVDSNLGLAESTYRCLGEYGTYRGVGVSIKDSAGNVVGAQCSPNAGGTTYSSTSFTAKVPGQHIIEVFPHAETVTGAYELRIAPMTLEAGAIWNRISFEPNNEPMNAFPIKPGVENALTSYIEGHGSGYLAGTADNDWYRLDVQAGRTYTVELFNVEDLLGLGSVSYRCYGQYEEYSGVGIAVLDPNLDAATLSCSPDGSGNAHNIVVFTATVGGPHYIRIFPHVNSVAGLYSIRVLPKHDEPDAGRDATSLEPNNRLPNAADMDILNKPEVVAAFEARTPGYTTSVPDTDWYHFRTEAGKSYVIELLDVADTLKLGSAAYHCYGNYDTYSGVGIAVFDATSERVTQQCAPNGEGNQHSSVEFQALVTGEYYFTVFLHFGNAYGEYKIRIREK